MADQNNTDAQIQQGRKSCYGLMFRDILHVEANKVVSGQAFSYELRSMGLARSDRQVQVIEEAWEDCLSCRDFEHCYQLSMAKLALETAISDK